MSAATQNGGGGSHTPVLSALSGPTIDVKSSPLTPHHHNGTSDDKHHATATDLESGSGSSSGSAASASASGGMTWKMPAAANDGVDAKGIISIHNVHKTYLLGVEGVPALRGVTLDIARGEFVLILGKSGGGKTSLLNLIGTIDKPTKGHIHIAGKRITSNTTDEEFAMLRLRKIGFVFQTFNLISSMTALENVALPMVLDGRLSTAEINARAAQLLTRVGIGARADHLPSQLSGGEQQRVTIARAIANRPDILLLDEPTGDLDTANTHIILNLLIELNRTEKMTCVMVTHDQGLKVYAHRVIHMVDGKVLKIESIPDAVRTGADAALVATIETDKLNKSNDAVRAAASSTGSTTEFRSANSYKFQRPI